MTIILFRMTIKCNINISNINAMYVSFVSACVSLKMILYKKLNTFDDYIFDRNTQKFKPRFIRRIPKCFCDWSIGLMVDTLLECLLSLNSNGECYRASEY